MIYIRRKHKYKSCFNIFPHIQSLSRFKETADTCCEMARFMMLPTCLWNRNEKEMNALRTTAAMKWGHNLIFPNWQALSGSPNGSPAQHACDWNGGWGLCVTVYSILNARFLGWTQIKTKVNCILIKIQTAAFSAVTTEVHLLLRVRQVRQIFTEPDTSSYIVGDKQKKIESPHPASLEMSPAEFTKKMNDKYLSGTWHAFLLNDRPAQGKPLSFSCTLPPHVLCI